MNVYFLPPDTRHGKMCVDSWKNASKIELNIHEESFPCQVGRKYSKEENGLNRVTPGNNK